MLLEKNQSGMFVFIHEADLLLNDTVYTSIWKPSVKFPINPTWRRSTAVYSSTGVIMSDPAVSDLKGSQMGVLWN